MAAASAMTIPASIIPWPPEPLKRISYLSLIIQTSVYASPLTREILFGLGLLHDEGFVLFAVLGAFDLVEHPPEELSLHLVRGELVGLLRRNRPVLLYDLHHVARALELVHPSEVDGAGVYYVHNGCALMLEGLMKDLLKLDGVVGRAPRYKGRARRLCHLADVKGGLYVAVAARPGDGALGGRGRVLAAGHAVDGVGVDEDGHVDVPSAGMDKMVPAYG